MANNVPASAAGRKAKNTKKADNVDTSKLVEQTLSRIEKDLQGDREQEAEIGMSSFTCGGSEETGRTIQSQS